MHKERYRGNCIFLNKRSFFAKITKTLSINSQIEKDSKSKESPYMKGSLAKKQEIKVFYMFNKFISKLTQGSNNEYNQE